MRGYDQHSMRMFRRPPNGTSPGGSTAPDLVDTTVTEQTNSNTKRDRRTYSCQLDGMVAIGCGGRSYTKTLHYSSEYAVGRRAVHAIIDSYMARESHSFRSAFYGVRLSEEEQRRRYLLMSLLQVAGVDVCDFENGFHVHPMNVCPEMTRLKELGWLEVVDERVRLTEQGLERSDEIGPFLFSQEVKAKMGEYECV